MARSKPQPRGAVATFFDGERELLMPSERGRWDTFYPAVARAVAGDGAPPVDPRDAVATARVLDAARESSAAGTVVRLG